MDEQSSGENSPETAKGICIGTAHFFPFGPLGWEDEPFPRALPLHASTPPRESAGRQKRNARTGLGAAVRGGEPASRRLVVLSSAKRAGETSLGVLEKCSHFWLAVWNDIRMILGHGYLGASLGMVANHEP